MLNEISNITSFIVEAFLHIWPYLLITIPLAVAVNMSGASRYISRAFDARPMVAIVLATAVGAFSPFCSCSVIPVVATLLIGGVPLAPVMSFWIASPSMDPETFFLSVGIIGWELAVWRLVGTLALSLSAGFVTHFVVQKGWLGEHILRQHHPTSVQSMGTLLKNGWQKLTRRISPSVLVKPMVHIPVAETASCAVPTSAMVTLTDSGQPAAAVAPLTSSCNYSTSLGNNNDGGQASCGSSCGVTESSASCSTEPVSFRQRLWQETWTATTMVAKFMLLAFFLEALITLYMPSAWITGLLGYQNQAAILNAALLGVPVYTSNLAALPMVSGLMAQGMNPAAGLAFLIAGPTTTLPAMAAVWGLASRRVFALYVSLSLVGAIVLGYLYSIVTGI